MDREVINNIKALGIDMIHEANSGHPGIVLGASPIIYTLYAKHMHVMPNDPNWLNRDRFVLSAGHGSAMLYATLHLAGYNISIDDLKQFRVLHSKTPGHPEIGVTEGVDMSTGPLGQGIASSVGMALAGKIYGEKYKVNKKSIFDYYVYVLCGDGDLMEGVSYEALSLAGSLGLNNLIILYDSNHVSLDGPTSSVFDENIVKRFQAMNFNTISIKDDVNSIDSAISSAKKSDKPTLIEVKTTIGRDSLLEGKNTVHGSPLTEEDILQIKKKWKYPLEPFYINEKAKTYFEKQIISNTQKKYDNWNQILQANPFPYPNKTLNLEAFPLDYNEQSSMRDNNQKIMQEMAVQLSNLIGGGADVASSTKTKLESDITKNHYNGRNIHFGVREHAMGSILNGLALSGFRPFGSTFLSFADYVKPAIRMSALMNLPVTYIFTHDSVTIGQDGPTHQPIEQLSMLRSIPNFYVFRPADSNEILGSWKYIVDNNLPSSLVLSRNSVPNISSNIALVSKGAYVVRQEENPHGIIIATGSEVALAIDIANALKQSDNLNIRVVSMPCRELFLKQSKTYQEEILPSMTKKIVLEFGSKYGWEGFVYNQKYLLTIDTFGYSGTKEEVLKELGMDKDSLIQKVRNLLK